MLLKYLLTIISKRAKFSLVSQTTTKGHHSEMINFNQETMQQVIQAAVDNAAGSKRWQMAIAKAKGEIESKSRGIATRMGSELIRLALDKMPAVTVAAQTLPEENASTSVLKKLGFRLVGSVEHPEDGLVWEWKFSDPTEA